MLTPKSLKKLVRMCMCGKKLQKPVSEKLKLLIKM